MLKEKVMTNSDEVLESEYLKHSKEHALRTSVAEGSSQAVGVNMSSGFLTPFLLAIGGNSFHVGLLTSLNGLADPLGEITGSRLMEKRSRKFLFMHAKIWIALLQIPVLFLAYLFWKGLLVPALPYVMILLWGLLIPFIYGIGYVSWLSWLGDLIPAERKGEFFASRNKVIGLVGLITFLVTGFLLDIFKTKGYVLLGFTVLFGVAIFFRLLSAHYASKVFNPRFRAKKQAYFSFFAFLKRCDNYGKFTLFQAFFFFAMMLSAPFFAVYMLEDLGFDYATYTIVSLSSTVFYLIFSPLVGKFSDKYGNIKLMYAGAVLFPLVPLLWLIFKSPAALVLFPGLVSGLANATFVIGTTDFSYDSTSPQKRGLCFAYGALLIGIGTLLGSFIGGWLLQYAGISFMKPLFFVFLLSSVVMVGVAVYFLPSLREERSTCKVNGLEIDWVHPVRSLHSFVSWAQRLSHWHAQDCGQGKSGKK